jgi:hypothetical protein
MRHVLWRRDDLDPDFDPDSVGPDRPLEYTLARHLDPNSQNAVMRCVTNSTGDRLRS